MIKVIGYAYITLSTSILCTFDSEICTSCFYMTLKVNNSNPVGFLNDAPSTTDIRVTNKSNQVLFTVSHSRVYNSVTHTVNLLCCNNRNIIVKCDCLKFLSNICNPKSFITITRIHAIYSLNVIKNYSNTMHSISFHIVHYTIYFISSNLHI